MEAPRGLYPWEQQAAAPSVPPAQQQPMQQQQQQPGVFLPPHLRRTALPQQQQQQQQQAAPQPQAEPAGMSGLMGLLAAHRGQPQPQPQLQPAQPQPQQQLPPHLLPAHLQHQVQQAPPAQQQQQHVAPMMPQQQQLAGPPPPALQAVSQPLPASGNSGTSVASGSAAAAAGFGGAPRSKGPPPGFKAPPPGFANIGAATAVTPAGATALAAPQPLQQQQGQADNTAAGNALLAALHSSSSASAQQAASAAAAAGAAGAARPGPLPPHLQHMQAGGARAPAEAPAGPSPAPAAAQQQAPASAGASSSSSQPQPQQPPQQQPLPRPSLQEWQARLQAEVDAGSGGGPAPCNLKEGLRWLAGFAPEAWEVLDEQFDKYFGYIRDKHDTNVLTCVVFFSLGHHDVYKGATANLDLYHAEYPAKVLNQRVSFYRLLFSHTPASKAALMASLIAHRPDVATWMSDMSMRQLFDDSTPAATVALVVAALLMLPEGWDRLLGPDSEVRQDPRTWLGRYVKAVQQERDNADKMSGFLWRKADAARQAVAAARAAAAAHGGASPAAAAAGSSGGTGSSSAPAAAAAAAGRPGAGWGHVAAVARSNAPPAAAASGFAAASPAAPNLLGGLMQQQLAGGQQLVGSPAGAGSLAAQVKQQQGSGVQDHRSASAGRALQGQQQAGAAAAQPRSQSTPRPAEAPAAAAAVSQDVIQMAIVQLTKDCPHVAKYLQSDLQARIRSMPGEVALEVLGTLHDLPKGWDKGHKQPAKHLAAVAQRAEAHALACLGGASAAAAAAGPHSFGDSAAAEGDDGWVTAGKGVGAGFQGSSGSNGNLGPSTSSSSGSGVGAGTSAGLMKQLARERPDVWQHLEERHMALIRPLTHDRQKQVVALLLKVGKKTLDRTQDPQAILWSLITNQINLLTQPLPVKIKEGLQRLADAHPEVFVHMDDGVRGRICAMPTAKALAAVTALEEGCFLPGWESHCNNPSAWIMGIISRALRNM